jgi:hypothetical protein
LPEAVFLELECTVISGYIGVKQLILPIRKYVMEIRDMQKQLKSLSILLDLRLWRSFATHDPTDKSGMMWERNTAVRYFITTRSRKRQQRITLV